MSWYLRSKDDAELYKPREGPEYEDAEFFTIKLHHGGEMRSDPMCYVGGIVDYFDDCNVDEISMLDISRMMKDVGKFGGFHRYWYRLPGTNMERGCFELDDDEELMLMCTMNVHQYVDIFTVVIPPLSSSQPELNTQNVNFEYVDEPPRQPIPREEPPRPPTPRDEAYQFSQEEMNFRDFDFIESTQAEMNAEEEFRELFADEIDEYESDGSDENYQASVEGSDASDSESFHSDSSNKDDSDDDLSFDDNVDDDLGAGDKSFAGEMGGEDESDHSSVYAGSEDERVAANSTDEEEVVEYPIYNEEADVNQVFEVGMCFKDSKAFRDAVKRHAIMERRPIVNSRNFGRKVQYVCEPPCEWRIYASPSGRSTTYQIKTFIPHHTCMPTFNQNQINSAWLAKFYEKDIRMNPSWPIDSFHMKIVNDLKCNVSKHAVYRAKARALVKINGTHSEQFSQVWKYGHELKRVLPESTVKILTENPEPGAESGRFMRLYVCLGPIKKAFPENCRKIVGLDGCHLKGPYGGQLLAAVGIDANEGMYPVAWAMVEAENTEAWTWFLQFLCQDIKILVDREWTFISDRQKVL